MSRVVTEGIILSRVNYAEADRILSVITPDNGVISVIAKGVRKQKSKLAGGIELFSISNITFIKGRSEIFMLISTRLKKNFSNISSDLNRTMLGYDVLKSIKKMTQTRAEQEHYELVAEALKSLDNKKIDGDVVMTWFYARCLWVEGHAPNLANDTQKQALAPDKAYNFNYEAMAFEVSPSGVFNASHIKLLRIAMAKSPKTLSKVIVDAKRLEQTLGLLKSMQNYRS